MTSFYSQQLPSEHKNGEKMGITRADFSLHFSGVESGLEFILNHFREPLWPRKVSTSATNREQRPAFDKNHAISYFEGSLGVECRISAFGVNQTNPDLVFIDLDARNFASLRAFKMALTKTLNCIKTKINGCPTVLWSGRGYHVIQPIDCTVNLDTVKEFAALTDNPNDKFLQFAERYLTGSKNDDGHHPAIKSCMLRVPHSSNAECKKAGVDAEVKIIQEWDGFRPDYRLLIGSFYADLIGKNQELQRRSSKSESTAHFVPGSDYGPIDWIEKLFQTPIEDYRKYVRDLILIPYLVVRRGITNENQIWDIVMSWANRCSELRRLEPSRREFERRIQTRMHEVMQERIPPMRLKTLKEKNFDLYKILILARDALDSQMENPRNFIES